MRLPSGSSLPSASTVAKVFGIGATVGPIVDSLHNQCLLQYDYAPITIPFLPMPTNSWEEAVASATAHHDLFCSSWIVPPLLGMAYIILGIVMPRLVSLFPGAETAETSTPLLASRQADRWSLQQKAIVAVATTALLILFSAFLETFFQEQYWNQEQVPTNHDLFQDVNVVNAKRIEQGLLTFLAILQWAWLDTSRSSLWIGILAYFGGPLCELPFCGHGIWHYLPQASDYLPFASLQQTAADGNGLISFLTWVLGSDHVQELALSSITGPCYFAVTTDAIAVARLLETDDDPV